MSSFFSEALEKLGFQQRMLAGMEIILPPIVFIPGGTFLMGSNEKTDMAARQRRNEFPLHEINVHDFSSGRYPVTVAEYACAVQAKAVKPVTRSTPHTHLIWEEQLSHPLHPVIGIYWKEALAYTRWLARMTGLFWRLPTEAEWGKAARGEDQRLYPWGNVFHPAKTNSVEHTFQKGFSLHYPGGLEAIHAFPHNGSPSGVYDLTGNVSQWCYSLFRPYPYQADDGRETLQEKGPHVLRGGNWLSPRENLRVACRTFEHRHQERSHVGFRLAQTPVPGP